MPAILSCLPLAAAIAFPLGLPLQVYANEGEPYGEGIVTPQGDAYADTDPSALVDFRAPLDPHGTWVDDPSYGTAWIPRAEEVGPEFTPYVSAGHWAYEDEYVWVSEYDWGWVPFHYGRWIVGPRGWEWIPGRQYAGAWVTWRVGDTEFSYVGWAPVAPTWGWAGGVAIGFGGTVPAATFAYVRGSDVFAPAIATRVAPAEGVPVIAQHTRPWVPATPTVGGVPHVGAHPVVGGPPPASLGVAMIPRVGLSAGDRGVVRARTYARPSTAVVLGARPAVAHAVRQAAPVGVVRGAAPRAVPARGHTVIRR